MGPPTMHGVLQSSPALGHLMATGRELRKTPRHERRLSVRYSVDGSNYKSAYTRDVALDGLFVVSRNSVSAGTTITLQVRLPDGMIEMLATVEMIGAVRWRRRVPAGVQSIQSSGFGVKITQAPDIWYEFISRL